LLVDKRHSRTHRSICLDGDGDNDDNDDDDDDNHNDNDDDVLITILVNSTLFFH
jgi:hypothetical protein